MGFTRKISTVRRLWFILAVVFNVGGEIFVEKIHRRYLQRRRSRLCSLPRSANTAEPCREAEPERSLIPVRLREVLEKLGPTFIKLGQTLSLRPDLVGEHLAKELSKLQDQAAPFPFEEVKLIIEQELGRAPEDLFGAFDKQPFAAASLAQVHRAQLTDGTAIAVKVQRPGIKRVVEQDLRILQYLAQRAERFISGVRPYHPVLVVEEFADWTLRELDFSVEGHNAERFRYSFRHNPYVKTPQIHWGYTAPRVLTMELVEGERVDNLAAIRSTGSDGHEVVLHLLDAFVQQFLTDGFFHADPHPGNVYVLANGVLCFTDFGMVGYLNESIRRELLSCFASFVNGDLEAYLKHFMHLAEKHSDSDVAGFQKDAMEILNELFFSQSPLSMAWLFIRLISKGAMRRITFPTGLALFAKAIITIETIGRGLYPQFDFNTELPPYIQKAADKYLDPMRVSRSLQSDMFDYIDLFRTLPERAEEVLTALTEDGRKKVKFDAAQMLDMKRELDRRTDTRVLGTLSVTVLIGTLLLFYFEHAGIIWRPRSGAGFALFLFLLAWFLTKRKGQGS